MKEFFEVEDRMYNSPDVQVETMNGWLPARPELWNPNLIDRFNHWRGKHWSYGQYFCIICGHERIELKNNK